MNARTHCAGNVDALNVSTFSSCWFQLDNLLDNNKANPTLRTPKEIEQIVDNERKEWEKIVYELENSEVYKNADISVIPTLFSEGTSLSCLEAMSTANAVIATRIGGLTDLIINNYNGKLIEPNKESLYIAIKDFLNNSELMEKCKKNAREVSKVFSKDIWIDKWKKVIKKYSKKVGKQENIYYNVTKIYVSPQNIESAKLNKIILEKLIDNNLVYIVNDNENRKHSYGRLQYIKEDEDLYRNSDYVLIDKDYENKENIIGEYIDI